MNTRAQRRLVLIGRQLTLERTRRREALGGLADALGEEDRSRRLAERSRSLAAQYAARTGEEAGADLAGRVRFSGALSRLAGNAQDSGAQAARDAASHARALAAAEQRVERLETREAEARRALDLERERRARDPAGALARKLHRSSQ